MNETPSVPLRPRSTNVKCGTCEVVFPTRKALAAHKNDCRPKHAPEIEPCQCFRKKGSRICNQHEGDAW
jgi:hypothetical protein